MRILFKLDNLLFEWDSNKARSNIDKHGITFELAAEVFLDRLAEYGSDDGDSGEHREFVIGKPSSSKVLYVVYVERSIRYRLISARPATKAEIRQYEELE